MTKKTFCELLKKRIQVLNEVECQRILTFYEETIDDCMEDGMSEEEAVTSLGDLDTIVKDILLENNITQIKDENTDFVNLDKKWKILLLAVTSPLWMSVGAVIFLFIVCKYLLIGCCFLMLVCVGIMPIMGIAGALVVLPFQLFQNLAYSLLVLGLGFLCTGFTIYIVLDFKIWWSWLCDKTCTWTQLVRQFISTIWEKVVL